MFRFHPLPQSPAFYWPADKAVTHAQMRDVMVWKRERQWSHQHFLAESTEILQWFPVFSETAIWNEERDFLWEWTLQFKEQWEKTGCFVVIFLGISAENLFNQIFAV